MTRPRRRRASPPVPGTHQSQKEAGGKNPMYCTHCGQQLTAGSVFCPNCGARQEAAPAAVPPPAPADGRPTPMSQARKFPLIPVIAAALLVAVAVTGILTSGFGLIGIGGGAAGTTRLQNFIGIFEVRDGVRVISANGADETIRGASLYDYPYPSNVKASILSQNMYIQRSLDGSKAAFSVYDEDSFDIDGTDSQTLYYSDNGKNMRIASGVMSFALSADGSALAYAVVDKNGNSKGLRIYARGKDQVITANLPEDTEIYEGNMCVVLSPDGKTAAYIKHFEDDDYAAMRSAVWHNGKETLIDGNFMPFAIANGGKIIYGYGQSEGFISAIIDGEVKWSMEGEYINDGSPSQANDIRIFSGDGTYISANGEKPQKIGDGYWYPLRPSAAFLDA
ncbi:MAG: zinc ribbon domain-containing protein, partial [Gracilibacteraceae bacterium]|nr:zinc ribbon domain-containing protein [Gracilibacteraceae bacterium]